MPYIGNQPGTGTRNRFIYTATASQTTFSGADDNGKTLKYSDSDYVDVYLNGICLVPVTDYTSTSKTSIVLVQAASLNDTLEVVAYDIATISDTVSKADGGTFEGDLGITSASPDLTFTNSTSEDTDGGRESTITFKGKQSGGEESTLAQIQASHDATADDQKGDLIFKTNDGSDGASPTEAMRIDSAQNVGINNSAPSDDLHILGKNTDTSTGITIQTDDTANAIASLTLMSRNSSNVNKTATIKNNAGKLELDSQLDVSYAGGSGFIAKFQNTTDATPYGVHIKDAASGADGYPLFQITSDDGQTTYFRVDSGTSKITIAPNTDANLTISDNISEVGSGNIAFQSQNTANNALKPMGFRADDFRFVTGSTERMRIGSGGSINATGVYNDTTSSSTNVNVASDGHIRRSTSSLRYKNTIADATHGLTELLTLRPVTFKGNDDGDTVFGGLIAEEVHDAGLTEFVQYNEDDQPDALAYGNMVSLCIKAIQEQQTTITAQAAKIETLETQNTTQATQIADLITRVEALEAE